MTSVATFFDGSSVDEGELVGRGGVRRDSRGRALLVPQGMKDPVRVPYSSASGLADSITDPKHFHTWELRYLARGMGLRPDLARLAAVEPYSTGLYADLGREKSASGRRLDSIIERAWDAVQLHEKADYGTAFHSHTEPGAQPPQDPEMAADVQSFWDVLREQCVTIVDTERFTVNDRTGSAGTFDHGVRVLGHPLLKGYVVADKKTGRRDPLHWAIQIASYAYGMFYDRETDERTRFPQDVNLDWGLVMHTPALTGKTELIPVDIYTGWEHAQIAAQARDAQDHEAKHVYRPATFDQRLEAANTVDELKTLWYSTTDEAERAAVTTKAGTL